MKTNCKILGLSTLKKKIAEHRGKGKVIAFTNGCFDILHYGHVSYLQKAKKNDGRILIIGLNSDASVRKIKGKDRPIVPQHSRAEVLAALMCVDYVTIFNEETPQRIIEILKPDVLIKGADWKGKPVAGSDVVKSNGGRVEYIRYVPQCSSTGIIDTILNRYSGK